jgi:hypothetical protein
MVDKETFDVLLLIARPAAGKSEIIDFLRKTPVEERRERFHIGDFEVIGDFPMLWTWFEEDHLLTQMDHPRLHTDEEGYFIADYLWDLLIERVCLEYRKKLRDDPGYHEQKTAILELSRGKEHGGYARAFAHLSWEVIERMAVMYVNVSWEESLRKNRQRFNPNRPDSILEHSLPDRKMKRLYRECDWVEVSAGHPEHLTLQEMSVPYAVFENEDDVTTRGGVALAQRLEQVLGRLWELYARRGAHL